MATKYYPTLKTIETGDWFGIPFKNRYSSNANPPPHILKAVKGYDEKLDIKLYLPTERWHLVRYLGSIGDKFTRVWDFDDRPDLGLRKDLGMWIIEALKMGDMQGAASNRLEEIEEHNKNIEDGVKKDVHEECREISKDMLKPLQNLEEYGDKSDTHYNYQVKADIGDKDAPR